MSESSSAAGFTDSRIEAALREYLERIDQGEVLDREEFLSQHPAIADRLRSLIEAEEILRKMGETGRAPHRGNEPTRSFALHTQDTIAPQGSGVGTAEECEGSLPREFGRYTLLRTLGQGAMGTVYLAQDTQLQRQVALKTPQFEKDPTPELIERFYREARAAACLRHPNTCPVYDVGEIGGTHYITMAYIEGHPLSAFVGPDKPQPERQVLIVVRKLAQALHEAHEHGIVHRDLKPSNIMIDARNEPIIMDFGLARRLRGDDNIKLTQDGMLIGTPAYMSPEQVDGEPSKVGPGTDQYSMGVILYELLTGTLPFRGSITGVLGQILTKEAPHPSQFRPGLDPRIEAVCLKMLAKTSAERFASLEVVAEELATILRAPRTKPRGDDPARSGPHPTQSGHHEAFDGTGKSGPAVSGVLRAPKPLSPQDLASLEELVHKCIARHDYDQVVQIVERIPEEQQTAGLATLLERARAKADEVAVLVCEIDEAARLENRGAAIRKARELLAIKPGHHRALEVLEQSEVPEEEVAAVRPTRHSTRRSRKESWIPWGALAIGLAVFVGMSGAIFLYLSRSTNSQEPVAQNEAEDLIRPKVEQKKPEIARKPPAPKKTVVATAVGSNRVPVRAAKSEPSNARGESPSSITNDKEAGLPNAASPAAAAPTKADARPGDTNGEPGTPPSLIAPFDQATAEKVQQDWSERLETPVQLTDSIGIVLRLVPDGELQMGTNDPRGEDESDAKPAHRVRITRPFYFAIHEVTRGQFAQFVAATHFKTKAETDTWGSPPTPKGTPPENKGILSRREHVRFTWQRPGFPQDDSHPVVDVTWDDAQEFCKWLSGREGKRYRLPSEAEWEYASRAGTTGMYGRGDNAEDLTRIANVRDASAAPASRAWQGPVRTRGAVKTSDGFMYTSPVGTFLPNNFGLYDTLGNAMEWCEDWYDPNYYARSPVDDPPGPTGTRARGEIRVARGGAFSENGPVYFRWGVGPQGVHLFFIGFRVVRDVLPDSSNQKLETAAPAADDHRRLWKGRQSSFENIRPGVWRASVAISTKSIDAEFSEMSRTQHAVYLVDRTRGTDIRIRLTNQQAFLYTPGRGAEYRPVDAGEWQR